MKLKVLGSVSPYCKNGSNCPGYLLSTGNGKILLDCGFGSSGNMRFPEDIRRLSIILSHYHKDHYTDLFAILYASLCYKNFGELIDIQIYLPETADKNTICDAELIRNNREGVFELHTYNENSVLHIDGCEVRFFKTHHAVENYSVCIEKNGAKFVYSGDMGYRDIDAYCAFCRKADLFLCESTFLNTDSGKTPYHLDAMEAALIARKADVGRLLLTHTWPERDKELYLREAKPIFDRVSMAQENKEYSVAEK